MKQEYPLSPRSLFICLAASANLIWFADAVLELAKVCVELEGRRTTYRLWWPTGVRKIGNLLKGRTEGSSFSGDAPSGDPEEVEQTQTHHDDGDEQAEQDAYDAMGGQRFKDPDARPPKNAGQRLGVAVFNALAWLHTPKAVFTFKYGLLSVLIWLPTAFRSSAFFAYDHKTLW
ncbi:hypothetical protein RQP46_000635 [Phenoliferia psychrophenolica]